jgi:exodeoxyribonuclease VII large subunit
VIHHFDVVAIIRGGGGDVGLSSYNNYQLAREIATFPIPVLTGIGHATNETVAEIVANFNAITPTKLAEHIIQHFHNFAIPVRDAERKIHDRGLTMLEREKSKFFSETKLFRSVSENLLLANSHGLQQATSLLHQRSLSIFSSNNQHLVFLNQSLGKRSREIFRREGAAVQANSSFIKSGSQKKIKGHTIDIGRIESELSGHSKRLLKMEAMGLSHIEKNIDNMSPKNVLKRGYSITLHNGHAVKNVDDLKTGDIIATEVFDGKIESTVSRVDNLKDE